MSPTSTIRPPWQYITTITGSYRPNAQRIGQRDEVEPNRSEGVKANGLATRPFDRLVARVHSKGRGSGRDECRKHFGKRYHVQSVGRDGPRRAEGHHCPGIAGFGVGRPERDS
jgi:hypothetical protein